MSTLFSNISELATPTVGLKKGSAMRDIQVHTDAAMLVEHGQITWLGEAQHAPEAEQTISLGNKAVVPALTDPHTHAVWAGSRLKDFEMRLSGVPYSDILKAGGGIYSTVSATAGATVAELVELALPRVQALMRSGVSCIEIKSGYGLSFEAEMNMLHAVQELQQRVPAQLVATLLIHVPPKNQPREDFVSEVCQQWIPHVKAHNLADAVDVFLEEGAFDLAETQLLLQAAQNHGLGIKLHADQFKTLGGVELACEMAALSVDHLEASGEAQIAALAHSDTVAVVLPGVSLHLGLPYAPARKIIQAGGAVAVATDLNPGSSPFFSGSLALALSSRVYGLTPAEALTACTVNAAHALGRTGGSLSVGQKADFLVLGEPQWQDIAYRLGNSVERVFLGGKEYVAG